MPYRDGSDGFVETMEDGEASPNKRQKTDVLEPERSSEKETRSVTFMQGSRIHILEAGIGKVRSELFRTKTSEFGGTLCSGISDNPNVLLVDEHMTADRLLRLLKIEGPQALEGLTVVYSAWLSACIKNKKWLPTDSYRLEITGAVLSAKINPLTSQQPKLPQAVIRQCSGLSSAFSDKGSDADSNCMESDEEDAEDASRETTIEQRRPLPVCILYYGCFYAFAIRLMFLGCPAPSGPGAIPLITLLPTFNSIL